MVCGAVRACLARRHLRAPPTKERVLEEQRRDAQLVRTKLAEDLLCVIGSVIIADAGMIPPHDEMRAAVVLAHQRMEDGFARSRVAHAGRKGSEYHPLDGIVVAQEHVVTAHAHLGWDVVILRLAHQRMQEQALHDLQRALLDILVRAVDGVARLEGNDAAPAVRIEGRARLCRSQLMCWEWARFGRAQQPNRPTQEHIALLVERADTRMRGIVGPIDEARFTRAIVLKALMQLQDGARPAAVVAQDDRCAFPQRRRLFRRHGERDRQRPGQSTLQAHVLDYAVVIGSSHVAFERAERASRQQRQVQLFASPDAHRRQRLRRRDPVLGLVAGKDTVHQSATMGLRGHESFLPMSSCVVC